MTVIVPREIELVQIFDAVLLEMEELEDESIISGGYTDIEVLFDGEMVARFGDEYHGHGLAKAVSFVDGALFALKYYYSMQDLPKMVYSKKVIRAPK